ncbi:hypothetical protein HMPREF0239_01747 [Clostridium sp. ATCC BAA-442]|nr:hypothetical protein HMPREF0239_01747 [Clostridium sp. ATCC BAA-442]
MAASLLLQKQPVCLMVAEKTDEGKRKPPPSCKMGWKLVR